jgi:hypothetical protein
MRTVKIRFEGVEINTAVVYLWKGILFVYVVGLVVFFCSGFWQCFVFTTLGTCGPGVSVSSINPGRSESIVFVSYSHCSLVLAK